MIFSSVARLFVLKVEGKESSLKFVHLIGMVAWTTTFVASAQDAAKPTHLLVTSPLQLVSCAPVTQVPCLSASVTPTDASGKPAPVVLPPGDKLAEAFTWQSGSNEAKPFYASAGMGPDARQHTNVVLVLVDISGSMNQPVSGGISRFDAVKGAIAQFLTGMLEGSDHVAIVPFESHNVVSTIHSAVFTTRRSDAIAQLQTMPAPGPKNNTALYQAVFAGVDSLQREVNSLRHEEGASASNLQPHLIVMTDGKNEVQAGDDPQLLNGELGLRQTVAQVQASHLDTIGIGFGDKSEIDVGALQSLTNRFFYAADAAQLLTALHASRSSVSHSIQLMWLMPESERWSLMGRDQVWTPRMRLDGTLLSGEPVRLIVPATTAPNYDRVARAEELRALIAIHPPTTSGWSTVLIETLLYLGAAVLLLILWFWVPRLIWGERYPNSVPDRSRRWSSDRTGVTTASAVQIRSTSNLPVGFHSEPESGSPLRRSAAQTTQIRPRESSSRTRLTF
jgi:Ca-activated chloride channel family protein